MRALRELQILGVAGAGLLVAALWAAPSLLLVVALAFVGVLVVVGLRLQRQLSTDERWRDVMPGYLSIQDRDLRILETNTSFRRDLGEDSVGRHCHDVYKKASHPCPHCPVLKTFEDGKVHVSEECITLRDGSQAQVVVTSAPLRDSRGRVAAVMEMSTNITEAIALRGELDRTREDYRQLFDIVPCYISIQDRDYRVVQSNALFKQDFGDASGEQCYRVYKGRDSICPGCPVEQTFADGEVHSSEEKVRTRDGREAAMIVYSMPVLDARGEVAQVMEVSTNITRVKQLQRQLAMVGLAVSGMAHRIKNVMTGLEGGIFVVNSGFELGEQDTVTEGWQMVQRNAGKIAQIARDLLFCSKERQPELRPGVVPAAIAREVHELYRARIEQEGMTFVLELSDEERSGTFDTEALHTLMNNLVANALDACRFDPRHDEKQMRIVLACRWPDEHSLEIEVADSGMGLAPEDRDRMFESFFSTKGSEGTGLGLFVVQKVVQEHGGEIRFASTPGEGTTFTAVLPAEGAPTAQDRLAN
ncbi:MAG: ATP-binding protein [Pseudomonadota bacterium]